MVSTLDIMTKMLLFSPENVPYVEEISTFFLE